MAKFKVYVVWGKVHQKKAQYSFNTLGEKQAFVKGVEETVGWMDAVTYDDKKEWQEVEITE